jgi:hypothetical protein
MSSGGGPPILGAYAVVRNLIRTPRSASDASARARLDAEELREVEYAAMGLHVPGHPAAPAARSTLLDRLRSRLASGMRRSE